MRKINCFLSFFCLLTFLSGWAFLSESALGQLITQSQAQRLGMTRQWYSQVQMDATRSKVKYMLLDRGTLFVSTDTGQLQAFDAETGAVLWQLQVGRRDLPTLQMDASDHYVATVNGTTAYVYNRYNGKLLWKTDLEDAPGAGPAVSKARLYVPGLKGRVQSFALELVEDPFKEMGRNEKQLSEDDRKRLDQERKESIRISDQYLEPLNVQALGRIFIQPVVTREYAGVDYVAWPTDRGDLNVSTLNTSLSDYFSIKYLIETGKDISSRPCVLEYDPDDRKRETGRIYTASRDGYVYCVREADGDQQWEYPCSEPIIEQIALIVTEVINKDNKRKVTRQVYAPTFVSGMYSLDAITGEKIWWTPGVKKFLAQSLNRVYCVDHQNNMTVLDVESGQQLGAISLLRNKFQYVNEITDRVYLASETGLIQCLRQIDQELPLYHKQNPAGKVKREIMTDDGGSKKKGAADNDAMDEDGTSSEDAAADLFGDDSSDNSDSGMADDKKNDKKNAKKDDSDNDNPFGGDAADDKATDGDATDDNPFGGDAADDKAADGDAAGDKAADDKAADDKAADDDAAADDKPAGGAKKKDAAADDDNPFGGADIF